MDSTQTRPHQPTVTSAWSNMWIAGAHTRTSVDLWSMEAAAESGRRVADVISGLLLNAGGCFSNVVQ